jgi:hypothetical protein
MNDVNMNDADANTNRHNNNTQFGLVDAIRKKALLKGFSYFSFAN